VTDDGLCWSPVAAALADSFDVIMVDARGHGRSEAPAPGAGGYGPEAQADDLAAVAEALGLRKPAILGHSMGAATALVLAGRYPQLPGAILLEDPPAWWAGWYQTGDGVERRAAMRARFTAIKRMTRDELLACQRSEQPTWAEAELEPWADAKHRFSLDVLGVLNEDNAADVDWPKLLARITCPALLVVADPERGGIVTAETAAALKKLVPQLEIAHVPAAGHSIRRDQLDRYLDVVRGFLARHRDAIGV
jgi:pimeloyl-ACP methyl ester carboxylesterase